MGSLEGDATGTLKPEAAQPRTRCKPGRSARGRAKQRRTDLKALPFLAPGAVILAIFVFYPIIYAFVISLSNSTGFNSPSFVGLANYLEIFRDDDSLRAIVNTLKYAVLYGPATVIVALAVAMLLNRTDLLGRGAMRTVIFLPFIISMAVASLAWGFILDPNIGILPYWLSRLGIHLPALLQSETWAMPTVAFVAIWKNFGYFMVIFLAGLQNVPRELYEAASIDGAGAWRKFTSVTLPGLSPTMTYVIVFAANGAFQAFDQIYIMTQGGPFRSTETMVYRVYTEGLGNFELGTASALSFVLLAITLVIGIVQLLVNRRQEKDLA
jgi:multiple sugar transport system permease protein